MSKLDNITIRVLLLFLDKHVSRAENCHGLVCRRIIKSRAGSWFIWRSISKMTHLLLCKPILITNRESVSSINVPFCNMLLLGTYTYSIKFYNAYHILNEES